ncbi:metallophosphoesterase [Pantanalinema sp. GBBB05]|uniref:metallophosphoesterase n=1 Tax=Pantanalinema sp. GBBB05 TaxID=2604139 RepID=UPI001D7F17B7|nr:metallophosphoesterase [Pantanalinema sp. GBBB05]
MHRVLTGRLAIEELTVTIAGLSSRLKGLRLVQMSDFHFDGLRLSERLLSQAISASNAADPDLVVLTGDFITDDPSPIHELVTWLGKLQSRYGTYAVLGNHDNLRRRSRPEVTQALTNSGIEVLWNQIAYPVGAELPLIGFADFWSYEFKPEPIMTQIDPMQPRLVLSHNPDSAELLRSWRVDLQLSGHTHGGQVILPGLGNVAPYMPRLYNQLPKRWQRRLPMLKSCARTMRHWEWAQGLHQLGDNQLYINRGLGTYLPGRLFCPPEVTVITLV